MIETNERQIDRTEESSRSKDGRHEEPEAICRSADGDRTKGIKRQVAPGGWVYFIETNDGALVKIGYSRDARKRFEQIKLLTPVELRFIAQIPGTRATEHSLHTQFAEYRDRGEWFRQVDVVRVFLTGLDRPLQAKPDAQKVVEHEPHGCMTKKSANVFALAYAAAVLTGPRDDLAKARKHWWSLAKRAENERLREKERRDMAITAALNRAKGFKVRLVPLEAAI
jgi:hypothetical protein